MTSGCVPGSGGRRAGSGSKSLFNQIIADLPLRLVYGMRIPDLCFRQSTFSNFLGVYIESPSRLQLIFVEKKSTFFQPTISVVIQMGLA